MPSTNEGPLAHESTASTTITQSTFDVSDNLVVCKKERKESVANQPTFCTQLLLFD
eukprot:m.164373 g.164373  ORF g.164373 m.164373 type:complete len:56 (+) comp14400_c0_seq8:3521-3688(+)